MPINFFRKFCRFNLFLYTAGVFNFTIAPCKNLVCLWRDFCPNKFNRHPVYRNHCIETAFCILRASFKFSVFKATLFFLNSLMFSSYEKVIIMARPFFTAIKKFLSKPTSRINLIQAPFSPFDTVFPPIKNKVNCPHDSHRIRSI